MVRAEAFGVTGVPADGHLVGPGFVGQFLVLLAAHEGHDARTGEACELYPNKKMFRVSRGRSDWARFYAHPLPTAAVCATLRGHDLFLVHGQFSESQRRDPRGLSALIRCDHAALRPSYCTRGGNSR